MVSVNFDVVEKTLANVVFAKYAEIAEYLIIHPEKDEFGLALTGQKLKEYKNLIKKFDDSPLEKLFNKKSGKETIINLLPDELRSLSSMAFWVKDLMVSAAKEKKDKNINIEDDKIMIKYLIGLENKIRNIMEKNGIEEFVDEE
jgi:hypothetical protein